MTAENTIPLWEYWRRYLFEPRVSPVTPHVMVAPLKNQKGTTIMSKSTTLPFEIKYFDPIQDVIQNSLGSYSTPPDLMQLNQDVTKLSMALSEKLPEFSSEEVYTLMLAINLVRDVTFAKAISLSSH